MSFTRANPTGWAPLEELTAAQINQIDINQSRAIDGTGGGTYTPGAAIIIAGTFGLRVDGPFETRGNTILGENTGDLLTVNALSNFVNGLSAEVIVAANGLTVNAGTAEFQGPVVMDNNAGVGGTFGVTGHSTFTTASFTGGLDSDGIICNAAFVSNSTALFSGATEFADPVFFSGDGRVRWRIVIFNTDANQTISPASGSIFSIGDGVQTASRNWTIDDTGMSNGDWFIATSTDLTYSSVIRDPATNPIGSIKLGTGFSSSQLFVRINGAWRGVLVGNVL